ncbi:MAG: hypothetical protein CMI16_12495 [Opitutaceae bacterium]|nr:hypothetical protein [Opitutaceae bacterium]
MTTTMTFIHETLRHANVEDLLKEIHHSVVEVDGDGNCFFRAIARAFGDQDDHRRFREGAVKALSSLNPSFTADIDRAWSTRMRADGTWADQFAVKSMANALGVCIDVYKQMLDEKRETSGFLYQRYKPEPTDPKFDAEECSPDNTIKLLNTGGDVHFDLLVDQQTIKGRANGDETTRP